MRIGFFLLKFPPSSETFVLNRITAFINVGYDVEIVALQKGGLENTHVSFNTRRLGEKTRWLLDEPGSKLVKLKYRAVAALHGLIRATTWKALNAARHGKEVYNLILAAIYDGNPRAFETGVFIAHFGPVDVTTAKLHELGVIHGKVATVFHGIDVSHRDVLTRYTPKYQQLFQRRDLMLPISNLWAGRLKDVGCPP